MAIDWDDVVLSPVMGIFGQGKAEDQSTWPLYTPLYATPFRLADAVFDAEYQQIDINPGDGSTSTTHLPVLGVRLALFPRRPAQDDFVFIPSVGKRYLVRDVQADGQGHAKLMLMETAA